MKTNKKDYIPNSMISNSRNYLKSVNIAPNKEIGVIRNGFFVRGEEDFPLFSTANKILEDL